MPSAYEGTDIISYLQRKYIIRQRRISYRHRAIHHWDTLFFYLLFTPCFISRPLKSNYQCGEGGEVKQHIQLVTIAVSGVYIIGRREKMTNNCRLPQIKENGAKNSCRDDKERNGRRKKSQVAKNLHQQNAECGATKGVQNQRDKLVQKRRCDA